MNQSAKIIKPKLGLLELDKQLGNVQQALKFWDIVGTAIIASKDYMNRAEN